MTNITVVCSLSEIQHRDPNNSFLNDVLGQIDYHKTALDFNIEYFGSAYEDNSIGIYIENRLTLLVLAYCKAGFFNYFDRPCLIHSNFSCLEDETKAYRLMIKYIKDDLQNRKITFFQNPFLLKGLFDRYVESACYHNGIIDLSLSEAVITKNTRKSYRSLINWGKRSLNLVLVDANNPDRLLFDSFIELHFKSAGRSTRSKRTWDLQYEMIVEGRAFLFVGEYDSNVATAVFVMHDSENAFYGVAANDRSLMLKGLALGHWTLFKAILHAKSMGLKIFKMGDLEIFSEDKKVQEIVKFKKGFVTSIEIVPVVRFAI